MKWMRLLPLVIFSLLLTSCFEIEEIVKLNANGSGQYQMVYDMGAMFDDPMMSAMIKGGEEDQQKKPEKQDTTMSFADRSEGLPADQEAALKKLKLRIQMDEENKLFKVTMDYPFDNVADLNGMLAAMEALNKKEEANPENSENSPLPGGQQGMFTKGIRFTYTNGTLGRIMEVGPDSLDITKDEQFEMMKNFMGDANIKLNYTMPSAIKATSLAGATIEGNVLTLKVGLLDMLEKKVNLQGNINY